MELNKRRLTCGNSLVIISNFDQRNGKQQFDGKYQTNIEAVLSILALALTIDAILTFEILNFEKMVKVTEYNIYNAVIRRQISKSIKAVFRTFVLALTLTSD